MTRSFWPGFKWRILAHGRSDIGRSKPASYLPTGRLSISSSDYDHPVEFDELVIDHWFHIEQMDDRTWWIGVGNPSEEGDYFHIHVTIDGRRRCTVEVEDQSDD